MLSGPPGKGTSRRIPRDWKLAASALARFRTGLAASAPFYRSRDFAYASFAQTLRRPLPRCAAPDFANAADQRFLPRFIIPLFSADHFLRNRFPIALTAPQPLAQTRFWGLKFLQRCSHDFENRAPDARPKTAAEPRLRGTSSFQRWNDARPLGAWFLSPRHDAAPAL